MSTSVAAAVPEFVTPRSSPLNGTSSSGSQGSGKQGSGKKPSTFTFASTPSVATPPSESPPRISRRAFVPPTVLMAPVPKKPAAPDIERTKNSPNSDQCVQGCLCGMACVCCINAVAIGAIFHNTLLSILTNGS